MADPLLEEDLLFWCRHSKWRIDIAVGLACGHDPAKFNPAYVHRAMSAQDVIAYQDLHSLVSRAIECGELPELMTPREFLHWADERGIEIRSELRDAISRYCAKVRDQRDTSIRGLTNHLNSYKKTLFLFIKVHYDRTGDSPSAIAKKIQTNAQLRDLPCPSPGTLKTMIEESIEHADVTRSED